MTIATTFTIVWVPYQLNIVVLYAGNVDHALLIHHVTETLTYVNSCVNPIIYALMWRPFRQSLIQVIRTRFKSRHYAKHTFSCCWYRCQSANTCNSGSLQSLVSNQTINTWTCRINHLYSPQMVDITNKTTRTMKAAAPITFTVNGTSSAN